jgi:hypothetical protein
MKPADGEERLCIIDGCGRKLQARGLCGPCYTSCTKQIAAGRITEEQAISAGLLLPRRYRYDSKSKWVVAWEERVRNGGRKQ